MREDIVHLQTKHTDLFNRIYSQYYPSLVGFARSYLKEQDAAEDVVQDVLLKIWDRIDEIDEEKNVKSLLLTATRNQCVSFLRMKQIRSVQERIDVETNIIALEYSTIKTIEFNDLYAQIDRILDSLPKDYKTIFLQNRFEGTSYSTLAEERGISIKTVEKRMSGILKIFRNKLQNEEIKLPTCLIFIQSIINII